MNQLTTSASGVKPSSFQESVPSKVVGLVEEMPWLEKTAQVVADALQPLVSKAEEARVMDLLHGTWLGHALHPVLSDLPVGLWSAAALFDLLDMDDPATVMSATGSVAAVGTAVTGLADWSVTYGRDRRLGLVHGLLNATALVLQLDSLYHRLRGRRGPARGLGFAGWLVATGAAYFGGELVFGRGLMVDHRAWVSGPEKWTAVLAVNELAEGKPRKAEVEGRPILVYRERGQVYAMEEVCTHAGGPLAEGEVKNGVVTCPWHGSQFRLTDGSLRRGPATFPQPRLETRINAGQVEVRGRQG